MAPGLLQAVGPHGRRSCGRRHLQKFTSLTIPVFFKGTPCKFKFWHIPLPAALPHLGHAGTSKLCNAGRRQSPRLPADRWMPLLCPGIAGTRSNSFIPFPIGEACSQPRQESVQSTPRKTVQAREFGFGAHSRARGSGRLQGDLWGQVGTEQDSEAVSTGVLQANAREQEGRPISNAKIVSMQIFCYFLTNFSFRRGGTRRTSNRDGQRH